MAKTVQLKIKRQDSADAQPRWEEFEVPWEEHLNVHAALMAIQRNPVTRSGQKTSPVVWDANCLEEVCGSCTMIVNGRVKQACSTRVDDEEQPIEVRPMTKFPLIRDLIVDRARVFADFKRVHAWVDIDGTHDLGPGPRYSQELAEIRYDLSRCMACGCCMEACPNYGPQSQYIGAAAVSQARHGRAAANPERAARHRSRPGSGASLPGGLSQTMQRTARAYELNMPRPPATPTDRT